MPVTCKLIDGKYHLVHKDGTLSSNSGKHDTLESCQAQASAINIALAASIPPSIAIFCPNKESFWASVDKLVYEKELMYAGNFKKDNLAFSINAEILDYWDYTVKEMHANGIQIPMPLEHTDDPEKTRAFLEDTFVKNNTRGIPALYGKVKFIDEESVRLAASADVSIYVTDEFKDAKGNTYMRPIRHVAFTNYPLIPGLEKFKAIAASFVSSEVPKMEKVLLKLATQLEIPNADTMDDTAIEAAIVSLIKPKQTTIELPAQLVASLTNTFKDTRITKLNALVSAGKITKATRDLLESAWCNNEALALSITDETAAPSTEKAFANLLLALEQNQAISFSEKTKYQVLQNPNVVTQNDLILNAEARAAAAHN